MNKTFAEFRVPIVVTIAGLAIVVALANSSDAPDEAEANREIQVSQNTESITQLQVKIDELANLVEEQTAALEGKLEQDRSSVNLQSITINKAMGRISARIAEQSQKTLEIQSVVDNVSASTNNLTNHTQTLDSAVVQQHRRHQQALKTLDEQRSEIERLLELNTQLGDIFKSFGK